MIGAELRESPIKSGLNGESAAAHIADFKEPLFAQASINVKQAAAEG
jgi:hypothetical protein